MSSPTEYLTITDVMVLLKVRSRSTIYGMIHRGQLPAPMQLGGQSRFLRQDVDRAAQLRRGLRRRRGGAHGGENPAA